MVCTQLSCQFESLDDDSCNNVQLRNYPIKIYFGTIIHRKIRYTHLSPKNVSKSLCSYAILQQVYIQICLYF